MFESPEVFEAFATIDASNWMLKNILTECSDDDVQIKARVRVIIEDKIAAKKIIGMSYSEDERLLHRMGITGR